MLKRIHIKNFRSCKDVVLDRLGPMTALVGRNGSGKTNILRAIDCLARMALSSDLGAAPEELQFPSKPSVTIDLQGRDVLYRYSFSLDYQNTGTRDSPTWVPTLHETLAWQTQNGQWTSIIDRAAQDVRIAARSEAIRLGRLSPTLPALNALLPEGDDLHHHLRPLLSMLCALRYYPFDETSDAQGTDALYLVSDHQDKQWVSGFQSMSRVEDSVLMRLLYAYYEKKRKFDEIQAILGSSGLLLLR